MQHDERTAENHLMLQYFIKTSMFFVPSGLYSYAGMQTPDFRDLAALLAHLSPGDIADVRTAFDFAVEAHASQQREDGAPYVTHVIRVAEIVAEWKADRDTIIAALLHDVLEDTPVDKEAITLHFGRKVAMLVEGITKFTQADLSQDLPLDRKIETLRKLFDVMRFDMRSILIKLADRLHNVQTISSLPTPERRRRFALETLTVYYKIAFHLGIRHMRRAFAELCVPHAFDTGTAEKEARDVMCEKAKDIATSVETELKKYAESYGLLSVTMFPQNLLIFHNRIQERGGQPLLQDAFFVSVIVRSEDDCYQLLKTLHTLYRPLSGQFRDFIAAPSDAGYQSLHTFVSLSDGSVIDVRIRTPEMYEQAMKGVAVPLFDPTVPDLTNISWLQRSAELDLKTRDSSSSFWEALESDIFREMISINIDRKRLSMPSGSTALDAAYAYHNDRANHTSALTVNGRPVLGSEVLKEDDEVHVTIDAKQHAVFSWLHMVSTRHARLLIVDVLKKTEKSEKIALGATLLQKEFDHYNKGLLSGLSHTQCQHVADHFRRQSFDQVLSMIGEGVLRARDIVFFLHPDRQCKRLFVSQSKRYEFRLHLTVSRQDVLTQLNTVIAQSDVSIDNVHVRSDGTSTGIYITGSSIDRLHFADFIDSLERQEWVSKVQTVLSVRQKTFIALLFSLAIGVMILDLMLFGKYIDVLQDFSSTTLVFAFILPLLPIIITNAYLLSYLKSYVVLLRRERWYFGVGFFLNMLGIVLVTWKLPLLRTGSAVLIVFALFAVAMLLLGYRFAETYLLFESVKKKPVTRVSLRTKVIGYLLRFCAVLIWGVEPVLIRYTSLQQLSPLLRVHIWAIAGAVTGFFAIGILNVFRQKQDRLSFSTPYNRYFWIIVFANLSYNYFLHKSLLFTTATNVNLILSYAPIFALLLGFVIWRERISYFRSAKNIQQMFLIFALSALGGTLLIYNDSLHTGGGIIGDFFALLIAFSDVAFIMCNIHYIKYSKKTTNTISLATHHFLWIAVVTLLLITSMNIFGTSSITYDLTPIQWFTGLGVGFLTLIGLVLTFEAFRRIDGLIAFLMLNLAPLIAFSLEVFFFDLRVSTPLFLIGGVAIVSASILAEIVSARCQKLGY